MAQRKTPPKKTKQFRFTPIQEGNLSDKEYDIWDRYIRGYPDYKRYYNYPVFAIEEARFLSEEILDDLDIIIIHPYVNKRLTFPEWLESPHLFDVAIMDEFQLLKAAHPDRDDFNSDDYDFSKEIEKLREHIKYGAIFLIDPDQGRIVQAALDQAELLRNELVKYLPVIQAIGSNLSTEEDEDDEDDSRKSFLELEVSEGQNSINVTFNDGKITSVTEKAFDAVLNFLQKEITEYFGTVAEFVTREIPHLHEQRVQITYNPIPKGFQIQDRTVPLIDKETLQLDLENGDFRFIINKQTIRAGVSRVRAACQTIGTAFHSGVGGDNTNKFYDVSSYDLRTVQIFVGGIYNQKLPEDLDIPLLFQLYELYAELNCIHEPFGIQLNEFFIRNLDKIDKPLPLLDTIIEHQYDNPLLVNFINQLYWLHNQLTDSSPFIEWKYDMFIERHFVEPLRATLGWPHLSSELTVAINVDKEEDYQDFYRKKLQMINLFREPSYRWMEQFYDNIDERLIETLNRKFNLPAIKFEKDRNMYFITLLLPDDQDDQESESDSED